MAKSKKLFLFSLGTLLLIVLLIYMGPVDGFTHGYYADEIPLEQILADDYLEKIPLGSNEYEVSFSPANSHLVGFVIYLTNQDINDTGFLYLTVFDSKNHAIDQISTKLNEIPNSSWYKVKTSANFKQGETYRIVFSVDAYKSVPSLQTIKSDYLPQETISGNILLAYAYAKSTFSFPCKVLLTLFALSVWLYILSKTFHIPATKPLRNIALFTIMSTVLSWNYMFNSMDNQNTTFDYFQYDSEALVTGMIQADQCGASFQYPWEEGYGLGTCYDLKYTTLRPWNDYITDKNWIKGYSRYDSKIVVDSSMYTQEIAVAGNYITFENGSCYQITEVETSESYITITLDSKDPLTPAKNGSLDHAIFSDANHTPFPPCRVSAYSSQYGLQGKIFKHAARYLGGANAIEGFHLVCCLALALILTAIVYLVRIKYNTILAGCFFLTFWLSPWIVNFARNLYWVEFTWFLPMLIGLFCAWKAHSKKCRFLSYGLAFAAILGKCLCGYEYISSVMLALIAVLAVDLLLALARKDRKNSKLLFGTICGLSVAALSGFLTALCLHAQLGGHTSLWDGIKSIMHNASVRTIGDNQNNYTDLMLDSFNASIWEVVCTYFHFTTQILPGINGNLFPVLCILPSCILGYDFSKKKMDKENAFFYIFFLLIPLSWFCLAKSHSYIHTHINYVLWYFGYVQICLYIIAKKILEMIGKPICMIHYQSENPFEK